jgi:hypothetical protein
MFLVHSPAADHAPSGGVDHRQMGDAVAGQLSPNPHPEGDDPPIQALPAELP